MIEFRWKSDKEKYERDKRLLMAKVKREKAMFNANKKSRNGEKAVEA
jgi:hypothetical protein